MKTNNWMATITGGALCLSLLACGSGKDNADQSQNLYEEVSYERPEPAEKPEPYTQEGETEVEVEVVKPAPGHTVADSVPKKEAAAGNQ